MTAYEQVQAILDEAGLTLASVHELPLQIAMQNGTNETPFTEWHVQAAKGLAEAAKVLNSIPSKLLKHVSKTLHVRGRIVFAELLNAKPAGMVFATTSDSPFAFFLVNSAKDQQNILKSPRNTLASFPSIKAKDFFDRTGNMETSVQYLMKLIFWHELGHLLDTLWDNALSEYVADNVKDMTQRNLMSNLKQLQSNVSPYAVIGGPSEAAAELFSMLIETGSVPPPFDDMGPYLLGERKREDAA